MNIQREMRIFVFSKPTLYYYDMNTACARFVFCILAAAPFLCGCTADATREKLAAADSLLYEERADTALLLLRGIRSADVNSDKDVAYFNLLMGHALYVSDEAETGCAACLRPFVLYECLSASFSCAYSSIHWPCCAARDSGASTPAR